MMYVRCDDMRLPNKILHVNSCWSGKFCVNFTPSGRTLGTPDRIASSSWHNYIMKIEVVTPYRKRAPKATTCCHVGYRQTG
jgi:hypothetical protein